ncbi:hypothetical protein NQ318_005155 [Aromia moschata]|uniref:Uncharacterized protein n=1 Tax=Aromia moschata TaxID=1265417 RepID=A0AAV8Y924_9CUCU|nr:hypothetical protein NQ318_005155 [Aromia moschata]
MVLVNLIFKKEIRQIFTKPLEKDISSQLHKLTFGSAPSRPVIGGHKKGLPGNNSGSFGIW